MAHDGTCHNAPYRSYSSVVYLKLQLDDASWSYGRGRFLGHDLRFAVISGFRISVPTTYVFARVCLT